MDVDLSHATQALALLGPDVWEEAGLVAIRSSTVTGLIARLYNANEGQVLLDGHDVKDLSVRSVRGQISLVQQEPCLLARSILENISLGLVSSPKHEHPRSTLMDDTLSKVAKSVREGQDLRSASQAHGSHVQEIIDLVLSAATLADAASFIERLDEGYGTSVVGKGNLISGGQKQRISLARALIKDPRILILDEATSSVDTETEFKVRDALSRMVEGRTSLIIAHRLSTIQRADKIIVMHKGQVREMGTHQELLANRGIYYKLYQLQYKDQELESVGRAPTRAHAGESTVSADD